VKIEGFEWSNGNSEKVKKHGLNALLVEDFFANSDPYVYGDDLHSATESRFIAFGKYQHRHMFVVFTFRVTAGLLRIRVISARYSHEKETRKFYEKRNSEEKGHKKEKT